MTLSVLPMFPTIVLVVYTLYNESNRVPLLSSMVAAIVTNAFSMIDARRHLARGFAQHEARALVKRHFVSLVIAGFVWGGLILGALGRSTDVGNWMVIGIIAGILGGRLACSVLSSPLS